jgi:lipid-A-disaccharide synthase
MASEGAREWFSAAFQREAPGVECRLVDGQAARVMTAANVVVTASGTATLETLLCKRPMVVVYRLGAATAWALRRLRLVKSAFFSQPNLLAGSAVVPELFQDAVSAESVGRKVLRWLDSPEEVARLEQTFLGIHEVLRRGASERAAEAVLALLRERA